MHNGNTMHNGNRKWKISLAILAAALLVAVGTGAYEHGRRGNTELRAAATMASANAASAEQKARISELEAALATHKAALVTAEAKVAELEAARKIEGDVNQEITRRLVIATNDARSQRSKYNAAIEELKDLKNEFDKLKPPPSSVSGAMEIIGASGARPPSVAGQLNEDINHGRGQAPTGDKP